MTTITTKNALTMRDSLRKSLFANEEASTADVEDGARSPVDKPNADAVAVPDKDAPLEKKDSLDEGKKDGDGVAASEESKTTVKAEAKVTETVATPAPDAETKTPEEVDWHKKFLQMERQFKSIQSSITPTQQDNSRLRDEIAALRAKLGESANSETKPKLDAKNLSEALKAIHETFPEGADLIEDLVAKSQQIDKLSESIHQRDEMSATDHRNRVISAITSAHSDAQQLIASDTFWKWVSSHDPGAVSYIESVIKEPWNHDPKLAIDIFDGFKDSTKETPVRKPSEDAAPARRTPTDISASSRDMAGTTTVNPGKNQERLWLESDWESARKELNANATKWERKDQLRKEMKKQLSLKTAG